MGVFTFCLFVMVGLGGLTRLTGSGLSMVTWNPLWGALPPLFEADWVRLFQEYQTSPEGQKVNFSFSLADFKSIFWLEYVHRLMGRLMGVILLIPTCYALKHPALRPALPLMGLLWVGGLLQGGLGWFMVKSGLMDTPWVSPYRLTAHLLLGLLLFGLSLHLTLNYRRSLVRTSRQHKQKAVIWLLFLLGATMGWGGLTAGLKAGLIYNTFPLMDGAWVPENPFVLTPWILNFFENPGLVQFTHRLLAAVTLGATLFLAVKGYITTKSRLFLGWAGMVSVQVALGAVTVLYGVPLVWGVLHQLGAFVLWGLIFGTWHSLRRQAR